MKCPNCGKQNFKEAKLLETCIVEGYQEELFQAYACLHCGRVEIYMLESEEVINRKIAKEKETEEKKLKEEARRKAAEEERNKRIEELKGVLTDENSTIKEARQAESELKSLGVYNEISNWRR